MKIKTIYEESYRPIKSLQSSYCENLVYRRQRMLNERSHQPLEWLDDSSDSETSSSTIITAGSGDLCLKNQFDGKTRITVEPDESAVSQKIPQLSAHENQLISTADESIQVGSDGELCLTDSSPTSNSNSHKLNNASDFNSHGTGDLENRNLKKKFNVKSSRVVHPSALRSLENRRDGLPHTEKKLDKSVASLKSTRMTLTKKSGNITRLNRISTRPCVKNSDPPNVDIIPSSGADWRSEYNSNFPNYPANIYSTSARLLTSNGRPQSAPLNILSRRQASHNNIDRITAGMARNSLIK